jgi:hypothetical protein
MGSRLENSFLRRLADFEAFLLDRLRRFPYATGVEQSHGSAVNTLEPSKYALALACFVRWGAANSPGLEWDENVREGASCRTSPEPRKTPHLTEDGRALPTL